MTRLVFLLFGSLLLAGCGDGADAPAVVSPGEEATLPGQGKDAGKVVVYRDTWGVPHIYAPGVAEGLYAMGRAQAEDRPEQLLINLKMALGEYASIAGESAVDHDLTQQMFDHYGASKRTFDRLDETTRRELLAYAQGVIDHYAENPEDVPAWWGDRTIDVHMFNAFGRYFLYNWSINEAYGDLRRAGIDPGFVPRRHASNQWTVGPARSASGNAILLADPHLGWWGVTRFWELRIHAGDLVGSGVTLPGAPYIGLGHNENLAWAMTTGGPDTADVFELELDPENHYRYRYDDEWRDLTSKEITLVVKDEDAPRTVNVYYSHHGPVIAWAGLDGDSPKAYAAKIAYDDEVNPRDLTHHLNFGKTYEDAVKGLASLGTFPQNVMVADTSGNIFYHRAGRVPIRAEGYDWSRPVNGSTSATEWRGFHPAATQLQIVNPPQGYMQNCNIPPDAMMVNGPFKIDDWLPEIFSSAHYGPARSGWINQRGARALELLSRDDSVTIDEALAYATDIRPYGIDRWIEALRQSLEDESGDDVIRARDEVLDWNGELARDSAPALKYAYFRYALADGMSRADFDALMEKIDQWYLIVEGETATPVSLTDAQRSAIASAFRQGLRDIRAHFGAIDAVYGDAFRVGRDDASWPVGGGGGSWRHGLTTLRTMGYGEPREDHTRWGESGQTSTQIIELSKPVKSWIYIPVGQSDRPDSPHYDDQAEKLFSKRQLKPSNWTPEALKDVIESRDVYEYPSSPDA